MAAKAAESVDEASLQPHRAGAGGLGYRRDIDGLRAIAVAPIVLAHAGVAGFAGGFIGVDLFFVISGYLITSIIVCDLREGRFSLLGFYRRRAVRLLPALAVMLLAVLAAGQLLMFAAEAKELGKSVGATAGFFANLYFLGKVDYFLTFAELRPLLHAWSLGVEEQFYLLYPLLLMAAAKLLRGRYVAVLAVVTACSMAFSFFAAQLWPEGAFYLLPSRAWQLGLGALAALGALPSLSGGGRQWAAVAGAAMVVAGFALIRPGMSFPFPSALLPCAGCALLLAYGEGAPTVRLLGAAPLRALGLVSYSLYLWHWPVFAFYRLETGLGLDAVEAALLILASLLLATLSFLVVERPFRRRFRNSPPIKVLAAAALAILLVGGIAAVTVLRPGSWRSATPEQARIANYWNYLDWPESVYQFRANPCFPGPNDPFDFDTRRCLTLAPERPNVAVVGDSHAAQIWRAFALRQPELNVMQATASGCHPLIGMGGADHCVRVIRYVYGPLLDSGRLDTVVLAARWAPWDLNALSDSVAALRRHGVEVVVLGPVPEYHGVFPALLARAMSHGNLRILREHLDGDRWDLEQRLHLAVTRAGGRYISMLDIICPNGACRLTAPDGAPMQFDYGHLTLSGARWTVSRMPPLPHRRR